MEQVLIFGGTSEGRHLAKRLTEVGKKVHMCVATEYGAEVFKNNPNLVISTGRMDQEAIQALILSINWEFVVDATHPYAVEISSNLKAACENTRQKYLRLLRPIDSPPDDVIYVDSNQAAAKLLNQHQGNILLTTGSKELAEYTSQIKELERLYVRILADAAGIEKCKKLGLTGKQIICMQGPFAAEFNTALLKQVQGRYLVTKDTGENGGLSAKITGARLAGAQVIVIRRPMKEEGFTFDEMLLKLGVLPPPIKRQIALVGIGPGDIGQMTLAGHKACAEAEIIFGAKRMLRTVASLNKTMVPLYQPQEIIAYLEEHNSYTQIAIVLSGDVGFYSGAKKLIPLLENRFEVTLFCGISSVAYFCAKLALPWEDVALVSLHGRKQNYIARVREQEKVFLLVDGAVGVQKVAAKLSRYGFAAVEMVVGNQLSSPEESILRGQPADFIPYERCGLSVILLINKNATASIITPGIKDEAFCRGKVPMTKEEVRIISLSKLALTKDAIVYDIGAGTGSIAVEAARMAVNGMVYAVEKNPAALELLLKNKSNFGITNMEIVSGTAPEMLADLPQPTHAFIGGSSGNLKAMIEILLAKNKNINLVINAISLETITEITTLLHTYPASEVVQVTIGRAKKAGNHHLMRGENPIYIITIRGQN